MAGGNPHPKGGSSSHKPSPSTSHRKSRWESGKNPPSDNKSSKNPPSDPSTNTTKPSPIPKRDPSSGPSKPSPNPHHQNPPSAPGLLPPPGPGFQHNEPAGAPFADPSGFGGPPPPAYGFHLLDRRTIALADGSVRSYFALPPDYQNVPRALDFPDRDRDMFLKYGQDPRELERGGGMQFPPSSGRLSPEGFRRGGPNEHLNSLGFDGRDGRGLMLPESTMKRKYGEGDDGRDGRDLRDQRDEFARQRQQLLQYGNPNGFPPGSGAGTSSPFGMDPGRGLDDMRASKQMRIGGDYELSSGRGLLTGDLGLNYHDVDPQALKKAFLRFTKSINEDSKQKTSYLENGKQGPVQCIACGRASKDFPDVHSLVMHAYGSHTADLHVDHLGLHKALCVLMGWNYARVPDNSKMYQSLPVNEAEANSDDLIVWPPMVIIHNTNSGKGKDGRVEGLGNRVMDIKLKDLGFGSGKAKSLYSKEGHQGITLVKFAADESGLKEALRLCDYFEKDYHGRKGWARAQASLRGRDDDDKNPNLVKMDEKSREKQRILYGYLATALDLEKVDVETRKRATIESKREFKP